MPTTTSAAFDELKAALRADGVEACLARLVEQLAQARHGDQIARSLILGSSLRTASTAAHKWATTRGRLIDLDMIQEANAALVSALDHFSGWKLDEFSELVEREVSAHLDRLYER